MKSIKFIFALLLVSTLSIACTSDSAEEEQLYAQEQATGDDGTADVMRTRD
ncbi:MULTISPECIES: hypothetical protein [Flavobacteriaceae]|uniref:Secreted protein n=1 Tax=Lutibacter litoralis TaxID=321268 RepID=A0ABV5JXX6_9FLAO|nr:MULTISPECIES: hypothetical protein [Flavobacteriaceae]GGK37871.1 hypothetical protein GCM10007963_02450 [Lutibacter litoralis]